MSYLLYTDESGDPGIRFENGASKHFVLTGIVVEDIKWQAYLQSLINIRKTIRERYGILFRTELKGAWLTNPRSDTPEVLRKMTARLRIALYA